MTRMSHRKGSPLLVLISAPSGAGKTTVCQQLLASHPELTRIVTCTTRPPRPGERDGIDYHFLDEKTFTQRVAAGEFLEYATVYTYHYGTLRAEVMDPLRRGDDVLLSVDVQGAAAIRSAAAVENQLDRALVTVFLAPLTMAELESRLRKRGTEDELVLQRRLGAARRELAAWRLFDYLVISGTMDQDLRRLEVILEAERMRHGRIHAPVWDPPPATEEPRHE
jgi:guanylate kinase